MRPGTPALITTPPTECDEALEPFPSEQLISGGAPKSAEPDDFRSAVDGEDWLELFPSEQSMHFAIVPDVAASPDAPARRLLQTRSQRADLLTAAMVCALVGLSGFGPRGSVPPPLPSRNADRWAALPAPAVAERPARPAARGPSPSPGGAISGGHRDIPAIQRVLNGYRDAYSILDAAAVKAVWPAADETHLRRRFAGIREQNMEFESCRISVTTDHSTAWCRGSLLVEVEQRRSRLDRREWQFTLQRSRDGRWLIATASPE